MQKLESANTIEQLNDEMRRMYKKRESYLSLKSTKKLHDFLKST